MRSACAIALLVLLNGHGVFADESPTKPPIAVHGQVRSRYEYRSEFDFNERAGENDSLMLLRTRFSAEAANPSSTLRLFAEGQDARSLWANAANRTSTFEDDLDLRQLWAEGRPAQDVSLRIGRQELADGDERLLGPSDWTNVTRTFDAVQSIITAGAMTWKAFAANVVVIDDNNANEPDHANDLYGLTTSYKGVPGHTVDAFFFALHNSRDVLTSERTGRIGDRNLFTFGPRVKGTRGGLSYGAEAAYQTGESGGDPVTAWALHLMTQYLFPAPWKPRVLAEYDHASGDRNPTDGHRHTFDQLYPSNHNKYGYIDFVGWRNMHDIRVSAGCELRKNWTLSADYHWFFLDSVRDSWYNAAGMAVRTAPAGGVSRTLGQELDLLMAYKLNAHASFLGGYSHFFAGPYLRDTGADDDADFIYAQTTLMF